MLLLLLLWYYNCLHCMPV